MKREPFPLQWPDGWQRTPDLERVPSRFFYGFSESLRSLLGELDRLGAVNVVITSDLPTRPNGLPYAEGRKMVADPGIAVWFVLHGKQSVIACDRWPTHSENMRAIALTIGAIRGVGRWGTSDVVTMAFAGFAALPPPPESAPPGEPVRLTWRDVLGCNTSQFRAFESASDPATILIAVRAHYRRLIGRHHPDHSGGDEEVAKAINLAWAEAQAELRDTVVVFDRQ